ncbi:hypothetical protein PMI27_005142 [Pseudomonas sp. GM41(2012)]|jgi:hypothetical protein|uniref:hypothetical protein n=1 Tax=Pseudomonas sp. (strain GM41(2012)) TaxID=1144708 RepID=UPI00027042CF|nr:hypothetical protein [Pseudomonas sp. GM41(2012)]EUB71575.1 hypothetical protein PMI27_005142 [Pseudomonas sp. GM41(2012)]
MVSEGNSLTLQQRVIKDDPDTLHCREITLRLSEDCRHLVLSRYTEHYGPALVRWIERSHTVSVTDLFRWLVANGETDVMTAGSEQLP